MIVFFKFYVMNFVDFVIDFYLYITSHVSQVFASCTHYTSYSLLNIVHVIVCVFGLINEVCKLLWILCKIDLMLENLWRMQEILNLGNLGFNSCFWKSYHHILKCRVGEEGYACISIATCPLIGCMLFIIILACFENFCLFSI